MRSYLWLGVGVAAIAPSAYGGFIDSLDSPTKTDDLIQHTWVIGPAAAVDDISTAGQVDILFDSHRPLGEIETRSSRGVLAGGLSWSGGPGDDQEGQGLLAFGPPSGSGPGTPGWGTPEDTSGGHTGAVAHAPLPPALALGLLGLAGVFVLRRSGIA
jgi:hypothetical protein